MVAIDEALQIVRVVVLNDEVPGLGRGQRLHQLAPGQRAVADIGPAVLVAVFASGRDVLDVHGRDAVGVFCDPGEGIGAAAHHPGDVRLPGEVRPAGKDQILRDRAVGKRRKLEVVVVPAEI
jgi:hypothetical protein